MKRLCRLGATDKKLGDFFGVSEQTINAWKKAHPSFLESLKHDKDYADAEVADKLYKEVMAQVSKEDPPYFPKRSANVELGIGLSVDFI